MGLVALLLILQPVGGCIDAGADEAWWETADRDWPAWSGLDAPATRPGPVPGLSGYLADAVDRTRVSMQAAYEQHPGSWYVQTADWYLREANRTLEANATAWAVHDVATARHLLESLQAKDGQGRTDERTANAYVQDEAPLQAWKTLGAELDRAWEVPNATALPLLFSLMEAWTPVASSAHLLASEEDLDAMDAMLQATRVGAFAEIALPLAEDASMLAGPSIAPVDEGTFQPLLSASKALASVTQQAPESDRASGHFTPHESWGNKAATFSERGWHVAAAAAAMTALVYAHTLHWSHEDRVPTEDRVLQDLEDLAHAGAPLGTFFAHMAWDGYASGGQDPAFMLLPVAIAELSPLIEALDERLLDGSPVPWEQTLDPVLEEWEQGWMATTLARAA